MFRSAAITLGAIVLFGFLSPVHAGGMRIGDNSPRALGRAGAFYASARDLTAIFYNPATLSLTRGTHLLISGTLTFTSLKYTRAGINPLDQKPFETVEPKERLIPIPYFVLASDFGLRDWRFAIGITAPNVVGSKTNPVDGPQRYAHVKSDISMVMYMISFSWRPLKNLSFGGTFIWADLFSLKFRLVVDGNVAALTDPKYKSLEQPTFDTPIDIHAKDRFMFSGVLGVWYQPIPQLELALSGMIAPLNIRAQGTMAPVFPAVFQPLVENGNLFLTNDKIEVLSHFPMDLRFGARYRHLRGEEELFDIELAFVVEFWNILNRQMVLPKGGISAFGDVTLLPPIELKKDYKTTYKIAIGGDYHVHKYVTLRAGFMYESPGTPRKTTNLDYTSYHRFGIATGISVHYKWFRVSLGYMHVFQPERNIGQDETRVRQTIPFTKCLPPYTDPATCPHPDTGTPPGNAVGAGRYRSGYDILAFGFELFFEKMFSKK